MARRPEPLSGGLVTSRDPSTLQLGELSAIQNAVYYPGNAALQRATGRLAFGSATANQLPVRGLRDLKFDNGDHFLMAMVASGASAFFASALVGTTGTFANATNVSTSGTALDLIHFNDEWFALGAGTNLSFYVSATAAGQMTQSRLHGLFPVTTGPMGFLSAGTWTAGVTGFFEYWTTEVVEYTKNGVVTQLESTFSGTPLTLSVTSTAFQATIFPSSVPVNPLATKWRVYRAGPKELYTDVLFPAGFRIGSDFEFASATSFTDGGATTGSFVAANATASVAAFGGAGQWATPTNAFTSDNAYATHAGLSPGYLMLGFPTFSVNEPVLGIEISIEGRFDVGFATQCSVRISGDGGTVFSDGRIVSLPVSGTDSTVTIGASNDLWGLNWTSSSLLDTKFRVLLQGITQNGGNLIRVDQVRARITYAGTNSGDSEVPFPAIVLEIAGEESSVGSHGQPPVATTGDIFQGSLVTNSVSAPANIYYSLPDEPDYFPGVYFIDFETPDNDRVTCIKTLNNRLGVFLASRFYRVNYLPTEADANFSRGICKEEVSAELGCINAMCACTYSGSRGQTEIAFVSNVGIHSTNLFTITDLSTDLDWRAMFPVGSTAIALVNDPEQSELLFYYANGVGTETFRCLHLSYDTFHAKSGGRLKLSGQVTMRNYDIGSTQRADLYSAWPVTNASGQTNMFLGYGATAASATAAGAGYVYRESGSIIPAQDPTLGYTTRRLFLAGPGNEWRLNELYTYIPLAQTSGAQQFTITPSTVKTNDSNGLVAQTARSYSWAGAAQFKLQFNQIAEGLQLAFAQASASANNPLSIQHHVIDGEGFGVEDSGA